MRKFIFIAISILLSSCGAAKETLNTHSSIESLNGINQSVNQFAFDLFHKISKSEENTIFSPISISSAMGMAYLGADGKTEQEFKKALHFKPNTPEFHKSFKEHVDVLTSKDNINQLSISNSIWLQQNFKLNKSYINDLELYYSDNFFTVDFISDSKRKEAQQKINNWATKETNNKIKNLIPDGVLTPQTRTVLVNAVYFLSQWNKPFDEKANTQNSFLINREKSIKTTYMNNSQNIPYFEDEKIQAIEIPYKGKKFSLFVVLAKSNDTGDWYKENFTLDYFLRIHNSFQNQDVDLSIPKFKMETSYKLIPFFQELGMHETFTDKANFSKMHDGNDLKITDIIHKAFVEVNEKGTEAAASTAVIMSLKSAIISEKKKFIADHPFLFMILEKETKTILFMGELANPEY